MTVSLLEVTPNVISCHLTAGLVTGSAWTELPRKATAKAVTKRIVCVLDSYNERRVMSV